MYSFVFVCVGFLSVLENIYHHEIFVSAVQILRKFSVIIELNYEGFSGSVGDIRDLICNKVFHGKVLLSVFCVHQGSMSFSSIVIG